MKSFSIIIPVKEINDYLRESVPYLMGLDYEDFEILIVPNIEPSILESQDNIRNIKTSACRGDCFMYFFNKPALQHVKNTKIWYFYLKNRKNRSKTQNRT